MVGAARESTSVEARSRGAALAGRQSMNAGRRRQRRTSAWLAGALICTLTAAIAPAAAVAGRNAVEGPAPPTTAEVRKATADFLAAHPAPRTAGAPPPGAAASGTGGIEPDGDGNGNGNGNDTSTAPFPGSRIVALYGAPQLTATIIGRRSPKSATRKLRRQARGYTGAGRRGVIRAFDLVAVIATASPGPDRKYRSRQRDDVIRTYLKQARKLGGRLVLDIQPGRAKVLPEARALKEWLTEPDVDLVIDAEWHVGRKGIPGRDLGKVRAKDINRTSSFLQRLIDDEDLPPKLLAVHHFTRKNIHRRGKIAAREDVQVTLNFDGIGNRRAKVAGYEALSLEGTFNGFSLFYRLDSGLMRPNQVLRLTPKPDYVMYQ